MDFYILIVDDEYPIREWLVHMLRSNRPQYYVESAENGQEALEKLHLKSFDLVITDIRMPHMDGVELLKNISAYFPGTVLLFPILRLRAFESLWRNVPCLQMNSLIEKNCQ